MEQGLELRRSGFAGFGVSQGSPPQARRDRHANDGPRLVVRVLSLELTHCLREKLREHEVCGGDPDAVGDAVGQSGPVGRVLAEVRMIMFWDRRHPNLTTLARPDASLPTGRAEDAPVLPGCGAANRTAPVRGFWFGGWPGYPARGKALAG